MAEEERRASIVQNGGISYVLLFSALGVSWPRKNKEGMPLLSKLDTAMIRGDAESGVHSWLSPRKAQRLWEILRTIFETVHSRNVSYLSITANTYKSAIRRDESN